MSVLDGEKIEELLWDQGLDFEHALDANGVPVIEVYVGYNVIVVGEVWADDNSWCIDNFTLSVEHKDMNTERHYVTDWPVTDEASLVRKVLRMGLDERVDKDDDV